MGRRDLLGGLGVALVGCGRSEPSAQKRSVSARAPEPRWGVQSGDVSATRAVVWSRSDRPSRMVVEWATDPRFDRAARYAGPLVTEATDFTGRLVLEGLPPGTRIFYRARFEGEAMSEPSVGAFTTAPVDDRDVLFAWSGDTNGQGWGIDPSRGGMPAYRTMLERAPHFFVHCGDQIYADEPIPPTITSPDGSIWRNLVSAAKSHPAATLEDYRGAFLYTRESAEVRALSAAVPLFSVWDDHEVKNNWWPGRSPEIDRLAAYARRAMFEYTPTLVGPSDPMYRSIRWGPLLEVFLLDGRSYRTRNYPPPREQARFVGHTQLMWLEEALVRSTATWKVIACDMPIGAVVSEPDGVGGVAYDGFANIDGPPRERELEAAQLLTALKYRGVKNVVWITADVHYAAAHRYDPAKAAYKDFEAFWEFVAGPMHATSFPQKRLDDTFGPELVYCSNGPDTFGSPATGASFFGLVRIDGKTRAMRVTLVDARGRDLHTTEIAAV